MNPARRFRLRASLAVAECPIHDSFIAMGGVRARRTLAHLPLAVAVLILATVSVQPALPTLVQQKLPPNTFTNPTPTPPNAAPINILLIAIAPVPMPPGASK